LSQEEEARVDRLKEQERKDAEYVRKLLEEDKKQSNRTSDDEKLALEKQSQNKIGRVKQSVYSTIDPDTLRQIEEDEKLAKKKQSLYVQSNHGLNFSKNNDVQLQIEEDEKLAKKKQSLYVLSGHGQNFFNDNVQLQIESDKKLALQKQSAYTFHNSAQPTQPFNDTLNQLPKTLGSEIAQFSIDEEFAKKKQSAYMSQLGDLYDQIDKDEHLAENLVTGRAEGMGQGFHHQVCIHNMNCGCHDTSQSNSEHIFKIHDLFCACKKTMRSSIAFE